MKKRLWLMLIACFIMGTLSGCGGKSAGSSGSGDVSGRAVSEGAVSGGGVSGLPATAPPVQEKADTFCNDRYVYYQKGFELVERPLAGGAGRGTEVEDLSYVCYADNDWVYYVKENINDDRHQIWRAPVIQSGGWQLHPDREELVLEDKQGFQESPGGVWCDGKYIVYISDKTYKYREYDIQEKRYHDSVRLEKCKEISNVALCGENVFISAWDDGLLRKRLGSDETEQIHKEPAYYMTAAGTDLFWADGFQEIKDVWRCPAEGKARRLITVSEIRQLLENEGYDHCALSDSHKYLDFGLFVRARRLYIQIHMRHDKKPCCSHIVVISKDLEDGGALQVEKKLTQCLNPLENSGKALWKMGRNGGRNVTYMNRGLCVMMTEDTCLMYLEDQEKKKNRWAYYDFKTGGLRFVSEKDAGGCLMYSGRYHTLYNLRLEREILDMDAAVYSYINDVLPNNYDF